jgi:acyl carrier protein
MDDILKEDMVTEAIAEKHDATLFRVENPSVLGASILQGEDVVLIVSGQDAPSGLTLRRSFLRCYGIDVDRVEFVQGLQWPVSGWCTTTADAAPDPRRKSYRYESLTGNLESEIGLLWSEILDVRHVGAQDDFWDSGGNSLDLVELAEALNERFGVDLDLVQYNHDLTVRGLAASVDATRGSTAAQIGRASPSWSPNRVP